ncbi:MAG: lysylphosphatidylglycerol synthase transmembrane domain-containing protein [Bacillota bacterium]
MTPGQIKRGVIFSVTVSITAILIIIFFTRENFSLSLLGRLRVTSLLAAALITVIFWLLRSLKLKLLMHGMGGEVGLHRIFAIYLASTFVAHVTPSSSGGLPFEIYFLHREGLPVGKSTALSVLDNMFTFFFFLAVGPVLLFSWGRYLNLGPEITGLFYVAAAGVTLFMVLSLFFVFRVDLLFGFLDRVLATRLAKRFMQDSTREKVYNYCKREIGRFREGLGILLQRKLVLVQVFLSTVVYWFFYLSLAPVLLHGLGIDIPLPPVILAQIIFNFIQPVFPTPGGSGGAELGFAYLFKFLLPNYLLGIFVAVWRFFMFYASLLAGGVFFVKLVRDTNYFQMAGE